MQNTDLGHMLLRFLHVSNNATCTSILSGEWTILSDEGIGSVTGCIDASSELFSPIIMASSQLRTKSFAVVGDQRHASIYSGAGGGETTAALFDWWRKIGESSKWQEAIFYLLCASYAFMATVALVYIYNINHLPFTSWNRNIIINNLVHMTKNLLTCMHAKQCLKD